MITRNLKIFWETCCAQGALASSLGRGRPARVSAIVINATEVRRIARRPKIVLNA